METTRSPIKWLRLLFLLALASFLKSIVNLIPFVNIVIPAWISKIITLSKIICLFQLFPHNIGYKKSAIYRSIMLASSFFGSAAIVLAGTIFSILAAYQEFHAHAEIISDKDAKLSRNWRNLFHWDWSITLTVSFASSLMTVFLMYPEPQADASHISAITNSLLMLFSRVLDLVYLLYLKKTIDHFSE